jgi:hypothetical protein
VFAPSRPRVVHGPGAVQSEPSSTGPDQLLHPPEQAAVSNELAPPNERHSSTNCQKNESHHAEHNRDRDL